MSTKKITPPVPYNDPESDPWLLVEEVAARTRTTVPTVYYWFQTGKLRHVKPGKRVLVRQSWLEDFMIGAR